MPWILELIRGLPDPQGEYDIEIEYDPRRRYHRFYRARTKGYGDEAWGHTRERALRELQKEILSREHQARLRAQITTEKIQYRNKDDKS